MDPLTPSELATLSADQVTAKNTLIDSVNTSLLTQYDPGEKVFAAVPPSQLTGDPVVRNAVAAAFIAFGWSAAAWQVIPGVPAIGLILAE